MFDLQNYFQTLEGQMFWGLVSLALLAGLALLTYGGDWLADGAASIANHFKVDPIVIGIMIVSTATSAPELFTCLIAAFSGTEGGEGLILGNIVGSNLANIALIMGLAAMVCPIIERERYVYWEIPWLIVASCLFTWFCFGNLERWEGGVLLVLMVAYMVVTMRIQPFFKNVLGPMYKTIGLIKDPATVQMVDPEDSMDDIEERPVSKSIFLVVLGALALMFGARFLVDSAQAMSIKLNVDQGFVGLTLVAIGTSLPELAASLAAARKGHTSIIAGNIFGSNLFNMLFVGGATALAKPVIWDGKLKIEAFLMMAVTLMLLVAFRKEKQSAHVRHMGKATGLVFLVVYLAIMVWSGMNIEPPAPQ